MIIEIDKNNFSKEVLNSTHKVLVDFWAPWCNPCKLMHPVLEKLEEILPQDMKIAKINIDNQVELASNYNIMSIPTFIVFEDGKVKKKVVGMQTLEDLKRLIED